MVKVFYRPEQVVDAESFSKSPLKPALVVEAWKEIFGKNVSVESFDPTTKTQLYKAHSPKYVNGILGGTIANGFGTRSLDVAKSLLYTTGSMLAAAKASLQYGVAASPTSGFHHAGLDHSGGYCTFNGLAVAALELLELPDIKRVGILDLDQHYGDGTADIIKSRRLSNEIHHFTGGEFYHSPRDTQYFFEDLPKTLKGFNDCDVVLYQAGADSHIDDPLGGWLTTEEMQRRDREIFKHFKKKGIPLAWNLAGGYQSPINVVVELHINTMQECYGVYGG